MRKKRKKETNEFNELWLKQRSLNDTHNFEWINNIGMEAADFGNE